MLIFTVDDEKILLDESVNILSKVVPDAEIQGFRKAKKALEAVKDQGLCPDVVFCDIEMPDIRGLELAEAIKEVSPDTGIIFVTAHDNYAVDAFRIHADGYIMKPLREERVREEMDLISRNTEEPDARLKINCFGDFAMFCKDRPVVFSRRKTKEMIAFIVDKGGRMCTAEEIGATLWEDEGDVKKIKTRIRGLVRDMRRTFEGIGAEDAMIRSSGQIGIARDKVDCDYFRLLDGEQGAEDRFLGEYMNQYSWAEDTLGKLYFEYGADLDDD